MTFTQTSPRELSIVGPGRVGRSLGRAALEAGIEVELLDRRQVAAGPAWPESEGARQATSARLVILAVPDAEIESACEAVCAAGPPPGPVGHLSGATGLGALNAAERLGVPTFALHPLQSFADGETDVAGISCAITAVDDEAREAAFDFARRLAMRPFTLADEDRALYHAAASIASNFLVCLEQEAAALFESAGIERGRERLAPLVTKTLDNWIEGGASALTGPIVRGDEATVQIHLGALRRRAPELVPTYLALAERTRALAART